WRSLDYTTLPFPAPPHHSPEKVPTVSLRNIAKTSQHPATAARCPPTPDIRPADPQRKQFYTLWTRRWQRVKAVIDYTYSPRSVEPQDVRARPSRHGIGNQRLLALRWRAVNVRIDRADLVVDVQ